MNAKRARKERHARIEEYRIRLRWWQYEKPPWWRFIARRKWKAQEPQYIRRGRGATK